MARGYLSPLIAIPVVIAGIFGAASIAWTQAPTAQAEKAASGKMLTQYCSGCHSPALRTAGIVINADTLDQVTQNAETWEKVVRQLRSRGMPPPGAPRPDNATYARVSTYVEGVLDTYAAANPNPGDLPDLHRLTRTEYKNAVRDMLALDNLPKEMDYDVLLPADNASSGFDNIADLLFLSPATMERYLEAARKVSRLAVGDPNMPLMVNVHRTPSQALQYERVEELSPGTRGGLAAHSYFPLDGEYAFEIETAGGARDAFEMEITIDGERKQLIPLGGGGAAGRGRGGPPGRGGPTEYRVAVTAGPHLVGATFVQKSRALDEGTLKTRNRTRGSQPAIAAVTIRGPYNVKGPGDTPSRRRIFTCRPTNASQEPACAKEILSTMMRRAYRRPVSDADVAGLMPFYDDARKDGTFDFGIQSALERMLVSPQFLYRAERTPANTTKPFNVNDIELASRLSFFLWSSIPDDELLNAAASGKLHEPATLRAQTQRMLKDPRSEAMVNNFAAQWLFLRDIRVKDPDLFIFPQFDENLRASFERETELFLDSILRENRSVLELITAKYSFLNERLAKQYGVPNILGSQFRRVDYPADSPRGGLLGQGSILTLTSYSIRTSPVLRGKYILENLLASPPPPPPPNVPALKTEGDSPDKPRTLRESMQLHRANPACASCHSRMDPLGFALENFDAIGAYRNHDGGNPIDTKSTLPDGTVVNGVEGVKQLILRDPERFASAVTEKLMMYALGRNVQYYDVPSIRKIVRVAKQGNYAFATLVEGVVQSAPFQMRSAKKEGQK